jgi:hypothetical protein
VSDHQERIRKHFLAEARALRVEAARARLFDHAGNRGSEIESGILRWLRARLGPEYTVSSGEVIDSFNTNASRRSRQQDGIVHRNDRNANRLAMPSGMRLVPVESVAATVEVKLTLTRKRFTKADELAEETSRLRIRAGDLGASFPVGDVLGRAGQIRTARNLIDGERENGIALCDAEFIANRVTFAVFAFGGCKSSERLLEMLSAARTINLLCCLGAGCVVRRSDGEFDLTDPDGAVPMFADYLSRAVDRHVIVSQRLRSTFDGYAGYRLRRVKL